MRVASKHGSLVLGRWTDRAAADEHLDAHQAGATLIGSPDDAGDWCTVIREGSSGLPSLGLLIETGFHGVEPQLLVRESVVVVGSSLSLYWIDPPTMKVIARRSLPAPFYAFAWLDLENRVLAIHEIGVEMLDDRGAPVWSFASPEVVASWTIVDDTIRISMLDGSSSTVRIADGVVE